jgi:glycosyltransferase involved in cell wall biosynthesis
LTASDPPLLVACEVYPRLYGAQRSLFTLYEHWHRAQRYRLHFLYFVDGALSEGMRGLGIPTTRLEVGPLLGSFNQRLLRLRGWDYAMLLPEMINLSRAVRDVLADLGADLLHCNTDRAGLMCCLGARWVGCPVVTHIRRDRSFGVLDRLVYHGSNELIWVSKRIRDEFADTNRMVDLKGRIIYNGRVLPDAAGPGTRPELLKEFGLPTDARIALVAASFDPRKDHETLVRAAQMACQEEPRLRFLVAGVDVTPNQGRQRKIAGMVDRAGLSEQVLFLGHRDDIGRLMRGVDVFVNPAKEEALGGALIEAIGYGVPCVATDTGGTAEIVPDGQCGYLVPRGDCETLADRIVAVVRDEAASHRFRANGRARFSECFTALQCAERTAAFFDEIIDAHSKVRT